MVDVVVESFIGISRTIWSGFWLSAISLTSVAFTVAAAKASRRTEQINAFTIPFAVCNVAIFPIFYRVLALTFEHYLFVKGLFKYFPFSTQSLAFSVYPVFGCPVI